MLAGMLLCLYLVCPAADDAFQNASPLDLSPEMKQFLDEKIERGLPPMQRLQSLVAMVFQSNELHFSYAPISRTAIETFTNRNGNCMSFTLLVISMARYLNLDARFREVEVPPVFAKSGAFVKVSQHLDAAVLIDGHAYAVDLFPEILPIEMGGRIVSDQRGLAHFFNNKGVDELGNGNYALAESFINKAIDTDPTAVGAWINRGAARAQMGKLDEAERYYRKALELEPKNLAAVTNLANICERTGRIKESLSLQKKAKEFREKNPYYHFNLGLQAYQQNNFEEALAHFKRAIKLKPKDHIFYFAVATAYGRIGQNEQMMAKLQLAEKYATDPDSKLRYSQKLELLKKMRAQGTGLM